MAPSKTKKKAKVAKAVTKSNHRRSSGPTINKTTSGKKKQEKEEELEYKDLTVLDGWPNDDEDDFPGDYSDFAKLFPMKKNAKKKGISPRMAALLYDESFVLIGDVRMFTPRGGGCSGRELPRILRQYFSDNKTLRIQFLACFYRLMHCRLGKGIVPRPNCIGEVVALRILMRQAEKNGEEDERFDDLPESSSGTMAEFDPLRSKLFDSDDKIALNIIFRRRDVKMTSASDYSTSDDDEEDEEEEDSYGEEEFDSDDDEACIAAAQAWVEKNIRKYWQVSPDDKMEKELPSRKEMIEHAKTLLSHHSAGLGSKISDASSKLLNIHPGRWFIAFSEDVYWTDAKHLE